MPAVESGSGTNMWYSFDFGSAHFISIDTETDYPHSPEGKDTIFKAGAMCPHTGGACTIFLMLFAVVFFRRVWEPARLA